MAFLIPTDAEISKKVYGFGSPIDALGQGIIEKYKENMALKEKERLINETLNKYNIMRNPNEGDYWDWGNNNPDPSIEDAYKTNDPRYAGIKQILDQIRGIKTAKDKYSAAQTDEERTSLGNQANEARARLKAMGIDPDKVGLGSKNIVADSNQIENNFSRQLIEGLKRSNFMQYWANRQRSMGVPVNINPVPFDPYGGNRLQTMEWRRGRDWDFPTTGFVPPQKNGWTQY
jgi:hypothetical protein